MRSRQSGDDLETTDLRGQSSLVRVAETEGVDGFVYLSFSGGVGGDEPLTRAKRATEERLRTSRLRSLVLRPSFFMEVWLGPALGFDYAQGRVTIYGTGEKPISWISLGDVAELVVRSLDDPLPNGEALELGGPEPVSPNEAVRIFEETAGRVFEVQRVPEDELRRRAESTESIQRAFASLLLSYAAGDVVPVKETLRLHPLRLLGVREYARGVLQTPRAT
jgi:NADH dehydrogenase